MQETGHARTTVLRWVRRFAVDGLLLVRSAIERHDAHCGRSADNWRRPNEVVGVDQRVRLLLSSRGTLISRTTVSRTFTLKVSSPMSNLRCLCSGSDKQRRLRFAAEQKERDWRCCVFADEKTFV